MSGGDLSSITTILRIYQTLVVEFQTERSEQIYITNRRYVTSTPPLPPSSLLDPVPPLVPLLPLFPLFHFSILCHLLNSNDCPPRMLRFSLQLKLRIWALGQTIQKDIPKVNAQPASMKKKWTAEVLEKFEKLDISSGGKIKLMSRHTGISFFPP
jgi:hypothetical protein